MALKIAIIGAGPAGCILARLLQHRSDNEIDITIFESEQSINCRSQGGTLDLHVKTGQQALKEAGLYDEFLKHARFDGEAISLTDKNFVRYLTLKGSTNSSTSGRPEIDRPVLRQILYESLPPGTVCWKHKLEYVRKPGTLHFVNQPPRTGFDLIVGADGGWSKTRNYLSATKPHYSGISGHAFRLPDAAQSAPDLLAETNRGSLFSWSDNKSIMAQCMGDGSLSISTWSRRPATWREECGYDVHDAKATKEACLRDYADWDPRLVAYTQRAEDDVVPRDLYMLPVGFGWEHRRGATLVGDAAHLMTPFAGEGVNLAFEDSLKLADAILQSLAPSPSSSSYSSSPRSPTPSLEQLDSSIRSFESEMFARAEKTSQMTNDVKDTMFTPGGGPRENIERYLLRLVQDEVGWVVATGLVAPFVYAYYFVFRCIW